MHNLPKILLVFTNIRTLIQQIYPTEFGALCAFLKPHGYDIRVAVINTEREFGRLRRALETFKPDLVGFTGISAQFPYVKRCIELTHQWAPELPLIAGGKHATLCPEDYLALPEIEAVCVGEGEHTFLEYLRAREAGRGPEGIDGLWHRRDGEIVRAPLRRFIEDHDSLPYMDRGIVDFQANIDANSKTVVTIMGRGCLWNCTFCSNSRLRARGQGTYVRNRSVPNLLGDIEQLSRRYSFEYIYFRDDTFTWDRDWTMQWCREYPRHFKYPFEMLTRADCLDPELIEALATAGCANIWIGLDSGNDDIRERVLHKNVSTEQFVDVAERMIDHGITPTITNMVGLPYETEQTFMDTVRANQRIHRRVVALSQGTGTGPKIFTFSPFPGTELYDLSEREGWLKPIWFGFRVYRDSQNDMPQFPIDRVQRAQRRFRYLVYRDSFPLRAWLFLIFDHPLVQRAAALVPRDIFYGFMRAIRKSISQMKRRATVESPKRLRHPADPPAQPLGRL